MWEESWAPNLNVQSKFCSAEVKVVIQEKGRDCRLSLGVYSCVIVLVNEGRQRKAIQG